MYSFPNNVLPVNVKLEVTHLKSYRNVNYSVKMLKNWWKWFLRPKTVYIKNVEKSACAGASAITQKLRCMCKCMRNSFSSANVRHTAKYIAIHRLIKSINKSENHQTYVSARLACLIDLYALKFALHARLLLHAKF